jgi:hypothetical protein
MYFFAIFPIYSHGGERKTFEVMTSTWWLGTDGAVASLSAPTLYQWSYDRNHKIYEIKCFEGCNLKKIHSKINNIF